MHSKKKKLRQHKFVLPSLVASLTVTLYRAVWSVVKTPTTQIDFHLFASTAHDHLQHKFWLTNTSATGQKNSKHKLNQPRTTKITAPNSHHHHQPHPLTTSYSPSLPSTMPPTTLTKTLSTTLTTTPTTISNNSQINNQPHGGLLFYFSSWSIYLPFFTHPNFAPFLFVSLFIQFVLLAL
jgi:hypothetical protein